MHLLCNVPLMPSNYHTRWDFCFVLFHFGTREFFPNTNAYEAVLAAGLAGEL